MNFYKKKDRKRHRKNKKLFVPKPLLQAPKSLEKLTQISLKKLRLKRQPPNRRLPLRRKLPLKHLLQQKKQKKKSTKNPLWRKTIPTSTRIKTKISIRTRIKTRKMSKAPLANKKKTLKTRVENYSLASPSSLPKMLLKKKRKSLKQNPNLV